MDEHADDINDVIEQYEKQFANTGSADKIVRAQGLMNEKLHAVTQELISIALHAEKEETRLKACLALQERVMGKVIAGAESTVDDTFKMMEAAARKREQSRGTSPE